ncbi:hypothetical protein JQ604_32100 [Bradyrhizobium jicamae]|uniref:hypothetical protein n=1 Tax=Bradyrhizobium jicamae TaxID=280332 RepID=UPI001BADF68A|nr:hypothetical protein [Bradyrhizobium jicamae]MBR0756847.1 hypothetical protein [Bradyrhizobium jicamae]
MSDPRSYPGMPRWLRVSGIAVAIVVLLLVVLLHASRSHHLLPFAGHPDHDAAHAMPESGR